MWVVKLSSALERDGSLGQWLAEIAEIGGGRVVIVPGAGLGLGQVRALQADWRLDDDVVRDMSVLAMAQYGLMMCGIEFGLKPVADEIAILNALRRACVTVWLPFPLLGTRHTVLRGTGRHDSDRAAAWLCARLNAERLVLVKDRPGDTIDPHEASGRTDFPATMSALACPVAVLHSHEPARLRSMLLGGGMDQNG